ncbi:MAG: ubiquinol-cytochrome c reductase iron-sulfur subunit [Methylicorpusculum sp.]|uniref:ubiquinol-cytochrome c reductase iron-sulfur subunit n=1 Tax=Methylicorpusculum sp. TaxID=2713644 RepID=UPI002715D3E4|nr:ubiquinol-cytochrome c reductase iron-sulfur subunit [Methylicorpusculum sp.]MDO8843005.1 ubiquinol-cytochrome c reductase iron-sulfur subunit [Methylicorpusculum sp.]MDO8939685.1 ubiquinol-cytochrome c reductase iron-sulfur subunit [Methylicorpusculum sp.]MDO9238856.1 ubiquinol-cytochrome c reductase iron-sulfur subunit [Methylicorpusculum sp.]MDP2178744.1 ubiquinol-cytochrome c reductase iron-sulfur subunit [Methylicorpusculum sp.]MDP2202877.1 ubiquinol-cytochrome c reductase iron-sulfur 
MNNEGVDKSKRQFLTSALTVVGAVGTGYLAVPFLAQMQPSTKAMAAGAPVQVDISKMETGQLIRVAWRGKPVWIVNRTEEVLATLSTLNDKLRDPLSNESTQPPYSKNPNRSIKPDIFIAVGLCTHLGCSPTFRPEIAPVDLGNDWKGGFFCPCHGSWFDLAGRVYRGVPAPTNLEIPPHRYVSDSLIIIGEDTMEKTA